MAPKRFGPGCAGSGDVVTIDTPFGLDSTNFGQVSENSSK
jgi:hypothetical protein